MKSRAITLILPLVSVFLVFTVLYIIKTFFIDLGKAEPTGDYVFFIDIVAVGLIFVAFTANEGLNLYERLRYKSARKDKNKLEPREIFLLVAVLLISIVIYVYFDEWKNGNLRLPGTSNNRISGAYVPTFAMRQIPSAHARCHNRLRWATISSGGSGRVYSQYCTLNDGESSGRLWRLS